MLCFSSTTGSRLPPPVIGLLTGLALWALARAVPGLSFDFPGQKLLALGLAGTGFLIELVAVGAFFRARTTVNPLAPERATHLVTGGLYRISRNPMYLGLLLVLSGWAVWLGNPLGVVLLAVFVWALNTLQIKPEETALRAAFGADYDAYCQKVRRWI